MQPQDPLQPQQPSDPYAAVPPQPAVPAPDPTIPPQVPNTMPSPAPSAPPQQPMYTPAPQPGMGETPSAEIPNAPQSPLTEQPTIQPLPPESAQSEYIATPQQPVDTNNLFMSDAPPTLEALPEVTTPKHTSRRILLAFSVFMTIGLAAGASYYIYNRNNPSQNAQEYAFNADGFSEANSAILETEATDSPESNETTTTNQNETVTPNEEDKDSAAENTASQQAKTDSKASATSAPKKKPTQGQSTNSSTFTCEKSKIFDDPIPAGSARQVELSVKAAIAGKTSSLTSWLSAGDRDKDSEAQPVNVDRSFKNLKPRSCTIMPVIIREKNGYSSKGIAFSVMFDKNAYGKPYNSSVNIALVNGAWRTDRIITAIPN